MLKECEFYNGRSRCFEISQREHKTVNLMIGKVCECTPAHILFSGHVIDYCRGKALDGVRVTIRYGTSRQSEYTDEKGIFNFKLPNYVNAVKIRFYKHGFIKRYIGVYYIKDNCSNCFCLYDKKK